MAADGDAPQVAAADPATSAAAAITKTEATDNGAATAADATPAAVAVAAEPEGTPSPPPPASKDAANNAHSDPAPSMKVVASQAGVLPPRTPPPAKGRRAAEKKLREAEQNVTAPLRAADRIMSAIAETGLAPEELSDNAEERERMQRALELYTEALEASRSPLLRGQEERFGAVFRRKIHNNRAFAWHMLGRDDYAEESRGLAEGLYEEEDEAEEDEAEDEAAPEGKQEL